MKAVENFEEMMRNIFLPLFQATNSPEEYPNIHKFLQVGALINSFGKWYLHSETALTFDAAIERIMGRKPNEN